MSCKSSTSFGGRAVYNDLIKNHTRTIAILEDMAQSLYRECDLCISVLQDMKKNRNGRVSAGLARVYSVEIDVEGLGGREEGEDGQAMQEVL